MSSHSLTNFEIQEHCQNEIRKIKDGAYLINLGEFKSIGTHWIAFYVNNSKGSYYESFGVEHVHKDIKKFIENKHIITNIYRIQAYDSIMCGYFCIGFIEFMLKSKSLTDYTYLFSPNDYEKNDKIRLTNFHELKRWKNYIVLFVASIENIRKLKNLKYHNISSFYYLQ